MRNMMLNPHSPIPLYHQLAEILIKQIRSACSPGEMLPSETTIAKQYGIGRPTVRQAMEILVRKGMVERRRGSGTFVKDNSCEVDLFSLAGTSQAFFKQGIATRSKIVSQLSLQKIEDKITNPFQGKSALFFSRLTLVHDEPELADIPVLLEDIYLDPELFPGLDKVDLDHLPLSQVISENYYLKPESGRQSFKISFLSKKQANLLSMKQTDPVLEVERTLHFPGVRQALFSRLYCRTEKFAFSQTIVI
ncbi:Transcriptional regulator, GntR family [Desulfamplus magnetovallimortis]|uniref:Transcriptional regulator, GntR family n=1 Tax=Desulfamplus magnetovallimortis TaxID=1246637 RepID=A0A1W1H8V3_9BACT|nr:GntR family transcriptional regulator [Desulfamplus magnetovallimortis]SLM28901.1 Transcriptional regulator, GntR family [Desulfamplus magnetovallimortis]